MKTHAAAPKALAAGSTDGLTAAEEDNAVRPALAVPLGVDKPHRELGAPPDRPQVPIVERR
jgi:hypothetical protein